MRINRLKTKEILDFEKEIGYELVVNEKQGGISGLRWYAHFPAADINSDGLLIGASGNGTTIDEAIQDYCTQISGKTLVFNVFLKIRKKIQEIQCPKLVHTRKAEDGKKLEALGELLYAWKCSGEQANEPIKDDDTWDYWLQEGKFKPLLAIRTKPEPTYVFKNVVVTFDQFVEILEKAKF